MRARSPRRNPRRAPARRGRTRPRPRRRTSHIHHEDARLRALHAVALMRREGLSLRAAAKRSGVSPSTAVTKARQALRKRGGVYAAIPLDEMRRPMRVLTERGLVVLDVRSSQTATKLAMYWNAVDAYLRTGDKRPLVPYVGRSFLAGGHRMPYMTDPRLLDRLSHAGQVSFEDLYESSA